MFTAECVYYFLSFFRPHLKNYLAGVIVDVNEVTFGSHPS
uniref:Uncharacterized protein n=1 Tax=Anguilla anguilla TaxID=7936 RepID=A0A0E9Q751_ANGAN